MADAPPSDPPASPEPLLDYEAFLGAKNLTEVVERYRAAGIEGFDEVPAPGILGWISYSLNSFLDAIESFVVRFRSEAAQENYKRELLLRRVQFDWYLAAIAHARKVERVPERFEPDCGTLDGVEVRIWGLFHGMAAGSEVEYKTFVRSSLADLNEVLFENGVGYFYSPKRKVTVPDFAVGFPLASIRLGFWVGLRFPVLMKELLEDVFNLGHTFNPAEPYTLSPKYHSLPVEARRGVEPGAPLPTHLMVEYELTAWEKAGALAPFVHHFAIVPRSMFMAAFAYGYAKARDLQQVDMVVGDLHTGEILHFLANPPREHAAWRLGEAYGRLANGARSFKTALVKTGHLGLSASIGAPILVATFYFLWWAFLQIKAALGY